MKWLGFVVGVVGAAIGSYQFLMSLAHLSERGRQRMIWVLWLNAFAGPAYFTELGWRYRRNGMLFASVGFAVACVIVLLDS